MVGIRRHVQSTAFLFLAVSIPVFASSTEEVLSRAQKLYEAQDDSGALRLLREARRTAPEDLEARWQEAFVLLAQANRQPDNSLRREAFAAAAPKADSVLRLHPESADAWFVGALSLGVESTLGWPRRKIALSKEMRLRIAKCLSIAPEHPGAWFLLGRWHEGFASLNPFEKGLVNLLLGGMPPGVSLDSARISLERAAAGRPEDLQIQLDLVRVLVRLGQPQRARMLAQRAMGFPLVSIGDRDNRRALAEILRSLTS